MSKHHPLLFGILLLFVVGLASAMVPMFSEKFTRQFFEDVKENYAPYLEDATEIEKLKFASALYQSVEIRRMELEEKEKLGIPKQQPNVFFNCTPYGPSPYPPTNVHELRPGDIGIVAALGDSITAGFGAGATCLLNVFTEFRGLSWSIGGDESSTSVLTLPNVLKRYNPAVKGFSVGTGKEDSNNANLDIAVSGGLASDIPKQAQELVAKIKANVSYEDYENTWKLVTIFIGGNDLCRICKDESKHSAEVYRTSIETTLDYFQANLPKTLVNLVPVVDVTRLSVLTKGLCVILHYFECRCGTGGEEGKAAAQAGQAAYIEQSYAIASLDKYLNDEDFTVVVQPFLTETQPPDNSEGNPDTSYFAPDCFHFSEKAHAAAAVGLWNNMFEPMDAKKTSWVVDEPFDCPADGAYITTPINNSNATRYYAN